MKNTLLLLSFVLMSIFAFGQTPQAFKYQAVARDLNGNPVINQEISVKISILAGSPEGETVYSEIHQTTTNSLGLLILEVGSGTTVTGEFAMIAWGNNASFIKTEMDLTGGVNFVFMGTSQLLSVPYSLFSENGVPDGQNPGDMLYWDGTQWLKVAVGVNGQVLTLNNGVPVWGGIQLPILYTSAVTSISAFTANCGGTVVSDGGSPVIARGICWNSSPNPTTANNKTINGSGTGSFTGGMTGLAASSVYYVRAYATNSAGTSYGNEVSFTTTNGGITLTTTAITAITVNTATSGGNITNNGGSGVIARGVCWNTSPFPTTANSKTTNGSGNGVFVSELTSLAPNTLYYVRAYATNSMGTSYGNQQSFTTQNGFITLTTSELTEITATTAIGGGEITNDGGSSVTARGVCWSNTQNPTITDSKTNDGSGNGAFVSNLTGLLPDTLYYVRAYATNGVGTYYGNEVSFTTLWSCGKPFSDERDGKNYNTVHIGEQCWMKENLAWLPSVSPPSSGSLTTPFNYVYGYYGINITEAKATSNFQIYGTLYNWPAAINACPSGWHLPSDDEWTTLTTYVSSQTANRCNSNVDYIAKALAATTNWNTTTNTCAVGNNLIANNTTGFTGLPGGYRYANGTFNIIGFNGLFWSSTEYSTTTAWGRDMYYSLANVGSGDVGKFYGFSVRCLRDN